MPPRLLAFIALLFVAAVASPVAVAAQEQGEGIYISEVMQNPSAVSDGAGEWFELTNAGPSDVDINGWTVRDDGIDTHVIDNGGPLVLPAGGHLVLGNNADQATNGGAAVDYSYNGDWFLANGDDEIILVDGSGVEVDRIEYDGGPVWPDPNGASMSLDGPTGNAVTNDDGANWCESVAAFGAGDLGTPGAANPECGAEPPPLEVKIHEVQGAGSGTPLAGQTVTVQGVVTALFEDNDGLDAFFVQEEDVDADGDPATSEGVFVFCRGRCPSGLATGLQATVTGLAEEFFGMTQIDAAGGLVTLGGSSPLPTATTVDLPASGSTRAAATFESIEGMHVTFPETLVVSEYFELARFGQVVLTETARPFQFTHTSDPSVGGYTAFLDELATRRIILDDNNNDQNDAIFGGDEPYYYPEPGLSTGNRFRGGDTISGLSGVLHWSWAGSGGTDAWRIRPIPEVYEYTFDSANPRPTAPGDLGGEVSVAAFNVLNYFTTLDDGSSVCGPQANQGCRGANSAAELARQTAKIVAALGVMNADVVGLVELENDGDDASIAALVDALNDRLGAGTYDYVATGFIGPDAIKVGLIYQPAQVTPSGGHAILDSSVDPTFIDSKNRPVLVQTFDEVATGERFTVAVNHLKSKGSPCDDVGDPDLGDGQANCAKTRTSAAVALANFLATDPTGSGDPDYLILGDLNSYRMEDPIDALETAGYADLLERFAGPKPYTFVFDGQLGYLDYAMANMAMAAQVTGTVPWNINADEVNVFDYNDEVRDSGERSFERESAALPIYSADAYRSSDHDPVLVGLALRPMCFGLEATIVGTSGDDVIVGTQGRDVIVGLGGDDVIDGLRGDDVICGNDGDDKLLGNEGDDRIDGGNGADRLLGNGGADHLTGNNGDDFLRGNGGDDALDGGNGVDDCNGNGGDDTETACEI